MRPIRVLAISFLAAVLALPGCGQKLSEEDLGTIEYEVPKLPGTDQPYELPPPIAAEPDDRPMPPSSGDSAVDASASATPPEAAEE